MVFLQASSAAEELHRAVTSSSCTNQHPSTKQPGRGGRQRAGKSHFTKGHGNLWASSESDSWICFFWVVSPPWPRRPGQHLPLPAMGSFTAPVGSIVSHPSSTVRDVLQPSFIQRLLRFWKLQYFFCCKNATVYLCSHFQVHWHVWWVDDLFVNDKQQPLSCKWVPHSVSWV